MTDSHEQDPSQVPVLLAQVDREIDRFISQQLVELLFERGVQLITKLKKNMQNKLLPLMDKLFTRKRVLIETVEDPLKDISQLEHTPIAAPPISW